jgi:hypothetical protein
MCGSAAFSYSVAGLHLYNSPYQGCLLPEPSPEALQRLVEAEALSLAPSKNDVGCGAHWKVDWRGSMALLEATTPTTTLEPVWAGPRHTPREEKEQRLQQGAGPAAEDLEFREVGRLSFDKGRRFDLPKLNLLVLEFSSFYCIGSACM